MNEVLSRTFDQIYLLNLTRRPDKLIKTLWGLDKTLGLRPQQSLNRAGEPFFQIWEAVDGYHPKIYARSQQKPIPAGAYGYLLSWERILQDALAHRYTRILLLDDDVRLDRDFQTHWSRWLSEIEQVNSRWKILLLGASQHQDFLLDKNKSYYLPKVTDGSFAIGLDRSLFRELLRLIKPHDQLLDSGVLRQIYRQYPGDCFVAYPNLMIADVTESDIRPGRDQERLAQKLHWDLNRYVLNFSHPLVSILIPCYRAERTLTRCLESIFDQTYRPLEIILVDDGSPDQSYQVASQMFDQWRYHPRGYHSITAERTIHLKLIHSEKNGGCYRARNKALAEATGDFIGFHDADDISVPYRIEEQVKANLQFGVAVTCCRFLRTHLSSLSRDWDQLERDLVQSRQDHHPEVSSKGIEISIGRYPYCCRPKVGLVTALFRKETVQQLGTYLEWPWGADDEYLRRLFPEVVSLQEAKVDYGEKYTEYKDKNKDKKKVKPMMNYLNDHQYLPKKYYRVNQVMYLSYEMTEQNLTSQRKKATKL